MLLAHVHFKEFDKALAALDQLIASGGGSGYIEILEQDADLLLIRDDPRYQHAIATLKADLWGVRSWTGRWDEKGLSGRFSGSESVIGALAAA